MLANEPDYNITRLSEIMARLRSPEGCPWDRLQTPQSLKTYILEEAYELLEAIDSNNTQDICDELGDLLLQVVFVAQIYSERNDFNFSDVINSICAKMIRRHPHVFADADSEGHVQRWELIKELERRNKGETQNLSRRFPATLPALKRTQKMVNTMATGTATQLLAALQLQQQQLAEVLSGTPDDKTLIEAIVAEMLLLTTSLATGLQIDAEDTLRKKTTSILRELDAANSQPVGPNMTNS